MHSTEICIGESSVVAAAKSHRNFERTLKNRSLDLALARPAFKTQPGLMRIDRDEFSLLHHAIDRQFIFLTSHDHELRGVPGMEPRFEHAHVPRP